MMDLLDQRLRFRANVINVDLTHVKFNNIYRTDTNEKVSDYMRTKLNTSLKSLNLKDGDVVEFDATVQLLFIPRVKMKSIKCRFSRITKSIKLSQ